MVKFSGRCLCGAVRYESSAEPAMAGFCQCEDCRRSSGAGHCGHLVVPEAAVSLRGEARTYERPADSGNVIARSFCPTCGSAMFSRNPSMPGMIFLRASTLDDLESFKPQMVVYASRGASWDRIGEGLPHFDKMPPGM